MDAEGRIRTHTFFSPPERPSADPLLQFAQELLSTFSTALGEVALQPSTGGTFVVEIFHASPSASSPTVQSRVLWDRKTDGGFPETKELKRRVRDVIEPGRDLGHVDRHGGSKAAAKVEGVGGDATVESAGTGVEVGKREALPSRTEPEAAGQAGGENKACEGKEACEDCG